MLSLMLMEYKAEGMSRRNDNGSQFIAQAVRQYLKDKGIDQEFSHVVYQGVQLRATKDGDQPYKPERGHYIHSIHQ